MIKAPVQQWRDVPLTDRRVTLGFDNDCMTKVEVQQALRETAQMLIHRGAKVDFLIIPFDLNTKEKVGIDDFLATHGNLEDLKGYIQPQLPQGIANNSNDDLHLSRRLAADFGDHLAYDQTTRQWRSYGLEMDGVWSLFHDDHMLTRVADYIGNILADCPTSKARSVLAQLQGRCGVRFDQWQNHLLPMKNGVLDIRSNALVPHDPSNRFIWQLPYDYDPDATCPTIDTWLHEAMGGCDDFINILVAFAKATVEGRSDLEVFLEAYGGGGTGKSTYIRFLRALVGAKNAVQTDLKRIASQFETARFYGKRLVFSPDEAAYSGSVDNLKKLTGRDPLPYERKGKDAEQDFTYEGMVIIAANQPLNSPEHTSGLGRRRITVPFNHRPDKRRCLIDFRGDEPNGEFAKELPGFLNRVLNMATNDMEALLKEFGQGTASSQAMHRATLLETNPIAAWAEDCLVYETGAKTQVGRAVPIATHLAGSTSDRYENQCTQLFPSYKGWCDSTGKKPVSQNVFSRDLVELARNQLGYLDVKKQTPKNVATIYNVRLRRPEDTLLGFVTGPTNEG